MDLHQKVCLVIKSADKKKNWNFTEWYLQQEHDGLNFLCSLFMWKCGGWEDCLSHTQITLTDKGSFSEESWACNFITLARF